MDIVRVITCVSLFDYDYLMVMPYYYVLNVYI